MLEVLRFLVVVFFAGAGYEVGSGVGGTKVLGTLNGTAVGLILGSGLGYVLGGVVGRTTASSAESARTRLHETSAEELIAGGLGAIGGVLLGAGVAWPVFLLRQSYLSFPLFAFVCVTMAYVGYLIGASKRSGVLAIFGERAGLAPREVPSSVLPRVLDTSVAIDGRIVDVVRAGFLHGVFWVPVPVLGELQHFADSADDARRAKGRRGLEVLETLKREPDIELEVVELDVPAVQEVDAKLVKICQEEGAALLTLDTNLAKAAALAGVKVLNLHALALALRPPVAAGEDVTVHLLKAGKEPGQGVGYLDDGTMVVVEQGRAHLGEDVTVQVASVVVTSNGRLVFAKLPGAPARGPRRRTPGPPVPSPAPRS